MKLTNKQKKIVEEYFEKKWKKKKCPFCEEKDWILQETILELREFEGGNLTLGRGSQIMPVIGLICNSCSYAALLSAMKLGVIDSNGKEKNEK